ncbi:MAG TPA: rhodanese-like domain-containing protein, partial [Pseudonocardiaceae bacterium]|nr:rhodanese-like domain-containing protein [Pseudonocardiaceae bacterium]
YDNLAGELAGGLTAWAAAGQRTTRTRLVRPDQIGTTRVLDIRQGPEFAAGHLPGADHIELGRLTTLAGDLPAEPTVVMCGHGERAMGAASLLERAGHRDLAVLDGGPRDWMHSTGRLLETGA